MLRIAALVLAALAAAACGRDAASPVEPTRTTLSPATLRMEGGTALLELVPDAAVTDPLERERLDWLRATRWAVAVHVARLAADPATVLVTGQPVAFDLSPSARLVYVGERRTLNPVTRSTSWFGRLSGSALGEAHVVVTALGVTASLASSPPGQVSVGIQPLGPSGLHAVVQVDPRLLPPD